MPEDRLIAARLDRIPITGALIRIVVLISLGFGFEIYDLFLTAYIAPVLAKQGYFTPESLGPWAILEQVGIRGIGSFVFALFAGLFCGSVFLGSMADRLGRRAIFTFSLVWYSLCTGALALQSSGLGLDSWRFLAGIGLGVELVTIDAYLAEWVPPAFRGRAFALCQTIGFSFVPIVAFLAWCWTPTTVWGVDGWRVVVFVGSLGAIGAWYLRRGIPESPRWLALKGRGAEADEIVASLEKSAQAAGHELSQPENTSATGLRSEGTPAGSPQIRRRLTILSVFNFFQTFGYYGFSVWVPTLLIARGIEITKSLEYAFLIAVANPIGPIIGLFLGDRIERKWQIVIAAAAVAVFGLIFATAVTPTIIIAAGMFITMANNAMSYAFHGYQAEIFPTYNRSRSIGFVYAWSRLSAALSGPIIAALLSAGGTRSVFGFIAASMMVVVISIGVFAPRSRTMGLETLNA